MVAPTILVVSGTLCLLLAPAVAGPHDEEEPPEQEDEAWCPVGSCLREIRGRPGETECYNPQTDVVTQEMWMGRHREDPTGWVQVLSNVDPTFVTVTCEFAHMHGLPELPVQYETWVTCNILNRNYTVVVHEIYDFPGNRALFRRYHADEGDTTSLYLYDIGEYFHINQSGCVGGPLSELRFGPMRGNNGRIVGTHEMFNFAKEGQQELYMGLVDVAGVPCDWWRSEEHVPNGISQTIDYFFSAPGWRWPSAHAPQVPVLLNVTGSRPAGPPGTPRHHYSHVCALIADHIAPEAWRRIRQAIST